MRRLSGLWRLAAACLVLLLLGAAGSARAVEVYLADDSSLAANLSSSPQGKLPVLFVHGHNYEDAQDADRNYRKNWQDPARLSFKRALERNAGLGIEPYYIRFVDQNRSITEDAREIGEAVELILHRHDPSYPARPTHVRVVIIAYSKGTISTRQYLKSLLEQVPGMPAPRPDFRPVSEFIAIAPPNHGISTSLFAPTNSLAVKQLYNGFRPEVDALTAALRRIEESRCTDSFDEPAATNYIQELNGHNIADSVSLDTNEFYAKEAPGSRPPGSMPSTPGTLYVTLFAAGNADFVGGLTPSTDCREPDGRKLARNLSRDAVNIEVPVDGFGALAKHNNTVHTAGVICLALYAASHHRSPEGQSCASGTDGVPIIPPPARAAAMLALDFSGSMSSRACPGCANTRADVLKESVELFVRLWQAVGAPGDRLGVTYFSGDVRGDETLLPLDDPGNAVLGSLDAQRPGGTTTMGGGLQRAIDTLRTAADAPIRRVILFTDGMQNVNPMVQTVDSGLVINNEPGRQNSNVSPASPPTRLDDSLGVAVDTIGVGAGEAFVGLLNDIATRTRGRAAVTTEPGDDLRRFFVEELINALRGFSPQLVAYRRGAVAAGGGTEAFEIEDGVRKLVFKVSWKRGDSLDFTVARDGADVTSAGRFVTGEFYKIFVIDLLPGGPIPAHGNWQVRVKGKAGTPYEAAAIVDGSRIEYDVTFGGARPRAGDPLDLVVRLTAGGRPVAARVNVTMKSPTAAAGDIIAATRLKQLPATEPAMTAAERQLLTLLQDRNRRAALRQRQERLVLQPNDKGEFRTRLSPQVPGVYTTLVTIEADDARLGRFSRMMTATVVVRFAASELKKGDVFTSACNVGGRHYVRLILSPRDARGRRMGPGLSSDLSARLSAGRTVGAIQDLGDGSYTLVLQVAPGDDPNLTLGAAGGVLFSGRLSQLSGLRR